MYHLIRFFWLTALILFVSFGGCSQDNGGENGSVGNNPPNSASSPHPADGEDSVSISPFLSWVCTDADGDPLTYDIYLGISSNPLLIISNLANSSYLPAPLSDNVTYYWKVSAEDDKGAQSTSPVWQFGTQEFPGNQPPNTPWNPDPEDSAIGINPALVVLSWSGGDPDGDDVTYALFWDTDTIFAQIVNDLNSTSDTLTNLIPNAHYYWKIIAQDEHGAANAGPIWEFFTAGDGGGGGNNPPYEPYDPSPPDGATDVDTAQVALSWRGGDPDGDMVTYYVYHDTSTNLFLPELGRLDTFFILYDLLASTRYYWKIKAVDGHGADCTGPLWSFFTADSVIDTTYTFPVTSMRSTMYSGEGEDTLYTVAREQSWVNYLGDSGGTVMATCTGQEAYNFWGLWDIYNLGFRLKGNYTLLSKEGFTQAVLTTQIRERADFLPYGPAYVPMLPWTLKIVIDGIDAGEALIDSSLFPLGYDRFYNLDVSLNFDLLKVGQYVEIEFLSDRFRVYNPMPDYPPQSYYFCEAIFIDYGLNNHTQIRLW